MPHYRNRYLTRLIKETLSYSPIVGIFGHRQVGKTTMAERLSKSYQTLDRRDILEQVMVNPESFLEQQENIPFAIDECQLAPPLFPVLKDWVRRHPKPGQFLLTGSVRFSSRKAIRESLTGRLIAWELIPMDFAEIHSLSLSDAIPRILRSSSLELELKERHIFSERDVDLYLTQGGLPGIFTVRNSAIRIQKIETQLNTILERDLKLIIETSLSYRTLKNLLSALALRQNQPLEWAGLSRQTRISVPTLKKLIAAFESIFILRIISTEGTDKKPVIFFEDQGEASYLAENRYDLLTNRIRFLFANLRAQILYRPDLGIRMFQYRNRGGGYVPLCFGKGNSFLGIIPILEDRPSLSEIRGAQSFIKTYQRAKIIYCHIGKTDYLIQKNIRCCSMGKLL